VWNERVDELLEARAAISGRLIVGKEAQEIIAKYVRHR